MISANTMRKAAKAIQKFLPKNFGFFLLIFPFHEPGFAHFISTAERQTMIKAIKDMLEVLESEKDFPSPESN